MKLFEEVAASGAISGKDAFDLFATYGFPFELTRELALERGIPVDEDGFRERMAEHREVSRGAARARSRHWPAPPSQFVGYEQTEVLTAIVALEDLGDGTFEAKLERSPFYSAGGGQVADQGWIEHEETGARAELRDAVRIGDDQTLVFEATGFAVGDRVKAVVPWAVRFPTMANHTATHLLHEALRRVLGEHVQQAGSAVRPDKLRFDFTHGQALTGEERAQVEELVNEQVFAAHPVRTFETPIDEARRLGAQMLFGEKYGDIVRVVEIDGFSRELCGGTHVRSTAEIGPFVILSEGSVGSGARRIEAVTSGEAFALLHERAKEGDELRSELAKVRKEAKQGGDGGGKADADFTVTRETAAGGVTVLVVDVKSGDPLDVSDKLKQQHAPAAVIVGVRDNGAAQLLINLDKSLEGRGVNAGDVIREAAALIGGKGGGRPTMARAGGKDAAGARQRSRAGRADDSRGARLKVIALDYGSARTGVAVSDATGTLARPLGVVERAASRGRPARARRARRAEGAERVVVGLPLTLRGSAGAQAQETAAFVASLEALLDVPVESFDERFTTRWPPPGRPRRPRRTLAPRRTCSRAGWRGRAERGDAARSPAARQQRPPKGQIARRRAIAAVAARCLPRVRALARRQRVGDSDTEKPPPRDDGCGTEADDPPDRLPRGLHAQGDGRSGSRRCARSPSASGT